MHHQMQNTENTEGRVLKAISDFQKVVENDRGWKIVLEMCNRLKNVRYIQYIFDAYIGTTMMHVMHEIQLCIWQYTSSQAYRR